MLNLPHVQQFRLTFYDKRNVKNHDEGPVGKWEDSHEALLLNVYKYLLDTIEIQRLELILGLVCLYLCDIFVSSIVLSCLCRHHQTQ